MTDAVYYAQIAAGTYVEGGYLDLGWLVAMLLVAFAAWQPDRTARARPTSAGASSSPPACSPPSRSASSFYAYAAQINVVAMALACAALLAVIVRMVVTFRENLRILDDRRGTSR